MFTFKGKIFASTAAIGAAAILAATNGYLAHAEPLGGAVNAPERMTGDGGTGSFADIVAKVAPAVVSINVVEKPQPAPADLSQMLQDPFGQGGDNPFGFRFTFPQMPDVQSDVPLKASGSGFFVSADGFIVTNNHVVDGAEKITVVTNDQRSLPARVVGRDPATDLAVLKVDGGPFGYVNFEDRARPRVGDWVVAVGNPFGLGGTATAGIVSALGRQNVSGSSYVNYMQIDAPINRGNSGGPTFDINGRVVGVNTSIYSPSGGSVGIGFDIPADVAARVTSELMAGHTIARGYIGATVQTMTPDLAASLGLPTPKGALIDELVPAGPAERAGLSAGDIVTAIDGEPVTTATDLTQQVALAKPNAPIRLTVVRNGASRAYTIRSGLRPSDEALASANEGDGSQGGVESSAPLGLRVAPDADGGLLVQGVAPAGDAAQKGLRRGDVILKAGTRPVESATDLAAAVSSARSAGRPSVPLLVARGDQRFYVPVAIGAAGAG